jgi:hypothetical protein
MAQAIATQLVPEHATLVTFSVGQTAQVPPHSW